MSLTAILFTIVLVASAGSANAGIIQPTPSAAERLDEIRLAQRRSCKAVSSCREAVEMWCGGYSGADRDKDGIPCENVCSSKAQVDQIRAEIGC